MSSCKHVYASIIVVYTVLVNLLKVVTGVYIVSIPNLTIALSIYICTQKTQPFGIEF